MPLKNVMDKIINKYLQLLLLMVLLVSSVQSQRMPLYLKAKAPEYILSDSEFEVSLLLRMFDLNADEIVLHILTSDAVDLRGVKVNGKQKIFSLNKSGRFKKSFDIRFDLKDNFTNYESFLNIGLNLISAKYESSKIDFKVDYVKNKKIIRTYSADDFGSYEKAINKVNLNFYKPQKTPGKSILLKQDSEIKFSFNDKKETSNFLVEFWGRIDNPSDKFLSFINGSGKDTIVSININENKILSVKDIDKIKFIKEYFVSKNAWYHFSLFININNSSADIYINDDLILSIEIGSAFVVNNFEVMFNNSSAGKIEIDQLKIWEFNNTPRLSLANKNYEYYAADSSRLFLNLSFNDENQIRNFNSAEASLSFKGISFKNSTAPIFSRAPELNAYLYNGIYQLEWKNNSRKDADYFELEKSIDGNNYKKIFETFASNDPEKIYYFSDHKDVSNDVIYYRVKQINKDRSFVYSVSLKIGQGEIKLFNLGQNYPNPFNPQTTISIEMLEAVEVDIYVYDIVGEKVAVLNKGVLSQGIHTFAFDGSNLPSGIYFCEAKSEKSTDVRKMILAK